MSVRTRIAELERKIERLEWEARNVNPCHCGHAARLHFNLFYGEAEQPCNVCLCSAFSPEVVS